MGVIVLDTGALIALERNSAVMWATLGQASDEGVDVLVPSTVIAQVWRGARTQARLATALDLAVISRFDPIARRVGELCGRTRTSDICDAHVALAALQECEAVFTSDPHDIRRLLDACGASAVPVITV